MELHGQEMKGLRCKWQPENEGDEQCVVIVLAA